MRTAIVTGAGTGIGAAAARRLGASGWNVVLVGRREGLLQDVAATLPAGQSIVLACDLSDPASPEMIVRRCLDGFGGVDALVNNAGVAVFKPALETSFDEWREVLGTNLDGAFLCTQAFGAAMARAGGGAIVNIASVAGMGSGPLHAYGPAKAGVINLTECLAAEWGPKGVRVNAVSPGFTHTPALEKGITTHTLAPDDMTANCALGRLVQAREIAHAVAFLASAQAGAITGVNLPVDAGYLVAVPWASYGGLRRG